MTTALAPAELLGHFRPGSPEWHAARAQGLGGSEIGAVLGLSTFESRFSLWHRKMGLIEPVDESPEMEWGKQLEPVILAKYADVHPEFVTVDRGGTWRSKGSPIRRVTRDTTGDHWRAWVFDPPIGLPFDLDIDADGTVEVLKDGAS